MNYDGVFKRFKFFSDLTDSEASEWSFLIYDCMAELSEMLISDSDNEVNSRRINAAAAALANYRCKEILCSRGEYDGISAGDVTINEGGKSLEAAYKLYTDCLAKIADIVKDTEGGFVFERMSDICTQEQ